MAQVSKFVLLMLNLRGLGKHLDSTSCVSNHRPSGWLLPFAAVPLLTSVTCLPCACQSDAQHAHHELPHQPFSSHANNLSTRGNIDHLSISSCMHEVVVCCRYVCDERWYNLTRSIRLRGLGFAGQDTLRQPTWCTLPPDKFHALSGRASQQQGPENILLIYKTAPKARVTRPVQQSVVSNVSDPRPVVPIRAQSVPPSFPVAATSHAVQ